MRFNPSRHEEFWKNQALLGLLDHVECAIMQKYKIQILFLFLLEKGGHALKGP